MRVHRALWAWMALSLWGSVAWAADASDQLARSVARAAPAVVRLEVRRVEVAVELEDALRGIGFGPRWLGLQRLPGNGTGFVVHGDGLVVTNHHVVSGALRVTAHLGDGRSLPARVVGLHPELDVALLKVGDLGHLPPLTFSGSDAKLGELVVSAGHPLGEGLTVSLGVVSGYGEYDIGIGSRTYLLTDSAILRGASGGPLLDARGRVLGMNVASFQHRQFGFAIPAEVVAPVAESLKRGPSGVRLGVETSDVIGVDDDPDRPGVLVTAVFPGGPAQQAGIQASDVIIAVNGVRTGTGRHVRRVLSGVTGPVDITVNREHVDWRLTLTPRVPASPPSGSIWRSVPVADDGGRVVVTSAAPPFRAGDVLVEVQGEPVMSIESLPQGLVGVAVIQFLRGDLRMFTVVGGSDG